jgi:hypothetical protein
MAVRTIKEILRKVPIGGIGSTSTDPGRMVISSHARLYRYRPSIPETVSYKLLFCRAPETAQHK